MSPRVPPPASAAIRTVSGPLDPASVGAALANEPLLRAARPERGNAGRPASAVAFARAPVSIERLGALQLGAANHDDETLGPGEADGALRSFAASANGSGRPLLVALAESEPGDPEDADSDRASSLTRLSEESGVAIVRGELPLGGAAPDGTGVVGAVPPGDPAGCARAAHAAAAAGIPLGLAPAASLGELRVALDRIAAAGLPGTRVLVTGAGGLVAAEHAPGVPGVGVDPARFDALLDLAEERGVVLCFDELGRIPSVRTVVSDHDVALAVLRAEARGLGGAVVLSARIRHKHRLGAWGGAGLEFVHQQFLPYLARLGAPPGLLAAVGGSTLARFLSVQSPANGVAA